MMIGALGLVGASAVLALAGTLATFAISFFVLVLGVSNLTVAGQAWISHRVDYRRRARSLGLYETGGAVRVGPVHYNTTAELDRLFETLAAIFG